MPKGYPKAGTRKISPARRCQVCRSPEKSRIETLRCAGVSLDKLAVQFGVTRDAIHRHMSKHVSEEAKAGYLIGAGKIARLAEAAAEESQSLIDYYNILRSALFFQLDRLAAKNDHNGVALMVQRATDVLKEIGRVSGQVSTIASGVVVNVQNNFALFNSPLYTDLQSGLIQICVAHPEARSDILSLFNRLDEKYRAAPAPPMIEAREVAHA